MFTPPQQIKAGSYCPNVQLDSIKHLLARFNERVSQEDEDDVKLQMCSDFQRGHVWTESQQIKFVEHLLSGGESGRTIYLNAPWWGNYNYEIYDYKDFVVVDGLQRLTAVIKFLDGDLAVFDGYYVDDIKLDSSISLVFNINNIKTKKEVLMWYLQMNDGGTPHTQNELERVKNMIIDLEKEN
jgi:uncharacterized protein with ParB-like and HNH nuclease domain